MKQYSVILNFTFEPHGCDVQVEYDDDGNEIPMKPEDQAKFDAFERTDRFFEENDVAKYIKNRCDAFSFVQYLDGEGEVLSAKWLEDRFAIEMCLDSYRTPNVIENSLRSHSLEDSEYEACGDTGWLVLTRSPKGEALGEDGNWDMTNYWEYGLTDYRRNKIIIRQIGEKPDYVDESKFLIITQKGYDFYKRMIELIGKGIQFSEEEKDSFKILCRVLKDPNVYPI